MLGKFVLISIMLAGLAGNAAIADTYCDVPMVDWLPVEELIAHLESQGWAVERVKIDDGCYEAYAFDTNGRFVEVHFNPQTLEVIKLEVEDHND